MTMQYVKDNKQLKDSDKQWNTLKRRGFLLGQVKQLQRPAMPSPAETIARWRKHQAIMLPDLLNTQDWQTEIAQSHRLMCDVLESVELSPHLDQAPYVERLTDQFPLLASSMEEHDEQGIEKVYFDAVGEHQQPDDEAVAEDLWCKASWLSFLDDDASLRFRFSFGMEALEDVAADPLRQFWAGKLCDAIFPESAVLTQNHQLLQLLKELLGGDPAFVERIVYFNAPGGGAQMHHDVERGHDGVVFGQLSGSTFWLALSKPELMDELVEFCANPAHQTEIVALLPDHKAQTALQTLLQDRSALSAYMEDNDHELIEAIMDRSPAFVEYLCGLGFAHILHAGDVLLMPQADLENCVWHSVCCLGDGPGEAVSFAIRKDV
ncbi:MAG: hypothetical protein Q9M16_00950 [Mariprofundus sp.]|nr:hypothetical protein [Mariprofundus sp.]